MMMV
jgi:hypothetical protein